MNFIQEGTQLEAVFVDKHHHWRVGGRGVESIVVSMEPGVGGDMPVAVVRFDDGSPPRMVNLTLAEEWELAE